MSKKSFYDVLWMLCVKNNQVEQWIEEGVLGKSKNTFFFTPKAKEILGISDVIGKKVEVMDFEWVASYNEAFDKKNIGIAGKKSDIAAVKAKMEKFCSKYDYTPEEIIAASQIYTKYACDTYGSDKVQQSHYFISKIQDGIEVSNLAMWCEEWRTNGQKYTSKRVL
jgi:hypothetical protein